MTTFLDRILEVKRAEVHELAPRVAALETMLKSRDRNDVRPFAANLVASSRLTIVSEVKRASPSKGLIAPDFDPVATATRYEQSGASAVSVLTDVQFFQGSLTDLTNVRQHIQLPVLRKDFIIDESQVLEARVAGADAVLLIVAALSAERLRALSTFIKSLGMDVLIEVHDVDELDAALQAEPSVLGVNNRNLHTFDVSLQTTLDVILHVPTTIPVISESGIHSQEDALLMASGGVVGLLVGESLMRAGQDGVPQLLQSLRVPRHPRNGDATKRDLQ